METGWTKLSLVSWTKIEIGLKINRNRKWYPNPSTISSFKIIQIISIRRSFRLQSLNLIVRDQNHADFHSTLKIIMSHHIRIPTIGTFNFNVISKLKLEVGNFYQRLKIDWSAEIDLVSEKWKRFGMSATVIVHFET